MKTTQTFTYEQVCNLFVCWQQTLDPQGFPTSRDLEPEDFGDAPLCAAMELGFSEVEYWKILSDAGYDRQF